MSATFPSDEDHRGCALEALAAQHLFYDGPPPEGARAAALGGGHGSARHRLAEAAFHEGLGAQTRQALARARLAGWAWDRLDRLAQKLADERRTSLQWRET
jgi:hypothetical protein